MLKMVDGTGIIGVDMICPLGGTVSPPQPPNFDKVEMEGVGSLTLPNSLKAPLERVELLGNSVQGENPAPDNPQEIKSAGKWNKEKQKYEIDVKVTNSEQGWTEEQTLTLTSDRPITKWDKLVEQGGEYGWLYGSKIYVVTGNEVFEYRSGYDQDAYTNRFIVINDLFVNTLNDKQLAYCKILKRVQYIYAQNKLEEGIDTNVDQLHIKLSNDRIGVLSSDDTQTRTAKIAEYIKNTYTDGIEILYATTDAVFLPLPESVQQQLQALHSENGTTHVFVDSGEVPCGIKLTYRKEK